MIEVNFGNSVIRSLFLYTTQIERESYNLRWDDTYSQPLAHLLGALKGMSYEVHYIKDSRGKSIIID